MSIEDSAPPILATFSVDSARREPVWFGLLASRVIGAPLVAATVVRAGPLVGAVGGNVEDAPGVDGRVIDNVRTELKRRGIRKPDVRVVESRGIGHGITKAIQEIRPRLVVLGSPRHHGTAGKLLGDTVEAVIHETDVPVVLVPHGHEAEEGSLKVVGAAFAATEEGQAALKTAAALAAAASASLRVFEVAEKGDGDGAASSALQDAVSQLGGGVEVTTERPSGDPAESLVAATNDVDLMVMGSRARGARRALMLGSVSRKVAEQAACPVLIVPRAAIGAAGELLTVPEPHAAQ